MITEFGNACNINGYYIIRSDSMGFRGKLLHRLIYEKYVGDIPDGFVVHHIDGDGLNNDLDNLLLLSRGDHIRLHKMGVSNRDNSTGFYRVYREKSKSYSNGFCFTYEIKLNGVVKKIRRSSLDSLRDAVVGYGYLWKCV